MTLKKIDIALILSVVVLAGCKTTEKVEGKKDSGTRKMAQAAGSVRMPLSDGNELSEEEFFKEIEELAFADEESTADEAVLAWEDADSSTDSKQFKKVYFKFNSRQVYAKDQTEAVEKDASDLRQLIAEAEARGEEATVVVSGHACHSAGDTEYNRILSEARAKSVADMLASNGIQKDRIKVIGHGQDAPAVNEYGEAITGSREEQTLNRRVELKVVTT